MRSVIFYQHGKSEVLELVELPDPTPPKSHVIIRLSAAALNRIDIFVQTGWHGLKLELPHILGADGAGEIIALGEDVTDWKIEDRVVINSNLGCGVCVYCHKGQDNSYSNRHLLGETVNGTYTKILSFPIYQLFKLPFDFSFEAATISGLVFLTAWYSLITRRRLKAKEIVLIVGAS